MLIVKPDELIGSMLADALDGEGISGAILPDDEALMLRSDEAPRLAITAMNRTHNEDLTGLKLIAALRRKWPRLYTVYLAALWPVRLLSHGRAGDRFSVPPGPYEITRLLPLADGVPYYRAKSRHDRHGAVRPWQTRAVASPSIWHELDGLPVSALYPYPRAEGSLKERGRMLLDPGKAVSAAAPVLSPTARPRAQAIGQ